MAITAWGRAREPQRALALLEEMKSRSVEPDVISFSAAISACGAGGQWERALSLLEEMQSRGLEPDVISFNAAISACGKGEQWERALSLLEEMQTRGVKPDVVSFSAAISACEKGGQWERALSLLEEMRTRGVKPDVVSFNAAISACEQCGEMAKAKLLYAQAVALRFLPRMENGLIDLHELAAPVARVAVTWSLDCLARGDTTLPDSGLRIITGKGNHSKDKVAVMKPAMEAMLASAGFAGLGATEDEQNTGMLVVRAESFRAWAAARHRD